MTREERVAREIVRRYGRGKLRRLVSGLEHGESGQQLAYEFAVSRQTIMVWKRALMIERVEARPSTLAVLRGLHTNEEEE